jgi:MYXO-CTERM domain-containing protein
MAMLRTKFATAFVFLLLASSGASANFIDFRTSAFSTSDLKTSFQYTDTDGTKLNIVPGPTGLSALSWNGTDGFGVRSLVGYDTGEIEGSESLTVNFSKNVYVNSFLATDLFNESGYLEVGYYSLNGGSAVKFMADASQIPGTTNGVKTVGVNGYANNITFTAPGLLWNGFQLQNHEFSVAGITIGSGSSVPELDPGPASSAMALLIAAGFALHGRRRRTAA